QVACSRSQGRPLVGPPTGVPARGPFVESRPRAPSVSPGLLGCPVGFDTPAVLSGTPGVADMLRVVAGAAAPLSPSDACSLFCPQPAPATSTIVRIAAPRATRCDAIEVMTQPLRSGLEECPQLCE